MTRNALDLSRPVLAIVVGLLTEQEKAWLNAYHARVREVVAPQVDDATRAWLTEATRAI